MDTVRKAWQKHESRKYPNCYKYGLALVSCEKDGWTSKYMKECDKNKDVNFPDLDITMLTA